jgi:DNA gyrase subunit B
MSNSQNKEYSASSIRVMEGLEAVRMRPGMYIGNTSSKGLHHLVYEVVDNSVDEALAGHCDHIVVKLHQDGSCSVKDNGRGIPTDIHPGEGVSAAEVVLTKLHAGGKFDKDSYTFSGGLHGVGVSVVNALSKWLKVTIYQKGFIYTQEFQCGKPDYPLKKGEETELRGTMVQFIPDTEIFKETVDFSFKILSDRFKEIAYLNKGLRIDLIDERDQNEVSHHYTEGIVSFVKELHKKRKPIFDDVMYFKHVQPGFEIECALQYNEGYDEEFVSFVNNINTHEGGTHVSGFKSALTLACNKKAKEFNILKKDETFSSEDVREGLICVLSIKLAEPQFEGQTKGKLGNHEVKGNVQSITFAFLESYFEENPSVIKKILSKAENALKAREAAKRARDLLRKKTGLDSTVLPGKLADCSYEDPAKIELFIVEGDSAGGSAKTGRDRFTQAILPLRGKIINVEKAALDKILKNEEIKALIAAIGGGVGNETFNSEAVRYHKVIIMTDADVDGAHIRVLLLTFFFRYMRQLIEKGYLYIAQPPLYKAKIGRMDKYLQNDNELFGLVINWAREHVVVYQDNVALTPEKKQEFYHILDKFQLLAHKIFSTFGIPEHIIEKYISFSMDTTLEIIQKLRNESSEYKELSDLIKEYKLDGFSIQSIYKNAQRIEIVSLYETINQLKYLAKPYMSIQRYKGLGEMNPDQLWETAMDPKIRKLLQVEVKDAVLAEHWFGTLMGEEVSSRRNFIEESAHFARNIDV